MSKSLHNRVNRQELRQKVSQETNPRTTLSFYAYARLADPMLFRDTFYKALRDLNVLGRIYVAHEGVNAQISAPTENLEALKSYLDTISFLKGIRLNMAVDDDGKSFFTLAIKDLGKYTSQGSSCSSWPS